MGDKLRFGEILVRAGALPRSALEEVLARPGSERFDLGEMLVLEGLIDESVMLTTISTALNLPRVELEGLQPDARAIQLVPREFCVEHHLLPIEVERSRTGEHLHVAMANPSDVRAIKQVTRQARLRIRPLVAPARAIRAGIVKHYGGRVPAPPGATTQPLEPIGQRPPSGPIGLAETVQAPRLEVPGAKADEGALFDFSSGELGGVDFEPASERLAPASSPPAAGSVELPSSPGRVGVTRRRRDDDFAAALDDADTTSSMGTSDMGRSANRKMTGSAAPRRKRPSGTLSARPAPARPPSGPLPLPRRPTHSRPVPAAPPGLAGSRPPPAAAPATGTPPPVTSGPPPIASAPPRRPPTGPHSAPPRRPPTGPHSTPPRASQAPPRVSTPPPATPLPPPASNADAPPMPSGVIDDLAQVDVSGVLERYAADVALTGDAGDQVIAQFIQRYGQAPAASSGGFVALEQAIARANSPTSRLLLALVRQLAQRGLVDLETLLGRPS